VNPTPELSFEVVEGPDAGLVVPVEGTLVIGSDESASVRLDDPHVEAEHTRVTASAGGALVEDLGEPGGTFVNDAELRVPTRMEPGDALQVGLTVLKLRSGAMPPSEVIAKPPPLAATNGDTPGYLAPPAPEERQPGQSMEGLLDVRTKRMARHAPLVVFVIVVYAVLIYLATSKL
jgi:pSer/pThr/pTyr-binding forkhead associated (FHA) protein